MAETRNLKNSLRYKAQRLREAARNVTPLVAMASPPTIAVSAAYAGSTISGVEVVPANDYTRIKVLGTDPMNVDSGQYLIGPGHMRFSSTAGSAFKDGYYGGNFYRMAFMTDAPVVEVDLFHIPAGSFRVLVDGKPTSLAATASSGDYSSRKTKITFASSAPRLIEIELGRMNGGLIGIGPNYSVWLPEIEPLRGLVISDSYMDNGNDYAPSYCESLGPSFLRSTGLQDYFLNAIGGLGYLSSPAAYAAGENARAHIPYEVTPYAPDWIGVGLGINDAGAADATLQAEVTAYYANLVAQNPNAIITVFGPWRAPGLNPAQSKADAIKAGALAQTAAVASKRLMYIDTYAENWHQIGGRVGAVSGVANSNIYIGPDDTHPNPAGQEYLRSRLLRGYLYHLDQLAA